MIKRPLPGQELKRLLNFPITPDCLCNQRAAHMDVMGCKWCRENVDLIVSWLHEEYAYRVAVYRELQEAQARTVTLASDKRSADREEIGKRMDDLGVTTSVMGRRVVIPFLSPVVKRMVLIAVSRAERCK